jgi:hypothetical protein
MAREVGGTREQLYREDEPDQIPSWVSDQVYAFTEGWMPLASERREDGWLRVTYGDVSPAQVSPAALPPDVPVGQGAPTGGDVRLGGWVTLLAVAAIVTTFAIMAKL